MYELTINLKPGEKTPLYEQLYEYIRGEIRDGHIASGEKLPSTRILCGSDRRTVSDKTAAYERKEKQSGSKKSIPV